MFWGLCHWQVVETMGKAPGAGEGGKMLGVVAVTKIAITPNSQKKL